MKWKNVFWLSSVLTLQTFSGIAQASTRDAPKAAQESSYASAVKLKFTHLPWNDPEIKELTQRFGTAYLELVLQYSKAVHPYGSDKKLSKGDLWDLLCAKDLQNICSESSFKAQMEKIYEAQASLHNYKEISDQHNFFVVWDTLHFAMQNLRAEFSKMEDLQIAEFERIAADPKTFTDLASLNEALTNVRTNLADHFQSYEANFQETIKRYPERLLITKPMIQLIEGQFFAVEKTDIIRSVKTARERLEEAYLSDLMTLLANYSKEDRYKFSRGNIYKELDAFKDRKLDNGPYEFWTQMKLAHSPKLPAISLAFIPAVESETLLRILKEFNANDGKTFQFLLHRSYQRAAWELRDMNQKALADRLEEVITKELFAPENLISLSPLGGGASTTLAAKFKDGLRCVFKPKTNFIKHPIDALISSHKKEIAASVIDRMLDLRMVPLTVLASLGDYGPGSCQYFAEDTVRARDMIQYDSIKPFKFKDPRGRSRKTTNILFFDWLIENYDRNVDNYIYSADGRTILIDHGFIFKRWINPMPFWHSIKTMIPSEDVYENIVELNENPEELDRRLGELLSEREIKFMKEKIRHFVKEVHEHEVFE